MKNIIVTEDLAVDSLRVMRGKDWDWEEQDGGAGKAGTIVNAKKGHGWVTVKWDAGRQDGYRIGYDNKYDLYIYVPQERAEPKPSVQEMRDALNQSIKYVSKEEYDQGFCEKRGYDMYGKSLKPNTNGTITAGQHGPFKVRRAISIIEGPKRRS